MNRNHDTHLKDRVRILGIAGSLRSGLLNGDLDTLPDTRDALMLYLNRYSEQRCANSELALMAALWGARQAGALVNFITLSSKQEGCKLDRGPAAFDSLVKEADGILLSSPVYFGANSCLIQNFIECLRCNPAIQSVLPGKIYSGLAVGAKRNGGQETTLIFQMADMLNLGFLGVGNSTATTCQYGGTVVAGNKGAVLKDELGIETCIGAGTRIAQTAQIYAIGKNQSGGRTPLIDFWILQDRARVTDTLIQPLVNVLIQDDIPTNIFHFCERILQHCKACNHCPNQKEEHGDYRCRINPPDDDFKNWHDRLVRSDVIVPTIFSPVDRTGLASVYQHFLERTRYLRRSDYMLSNRAVIPLIFCEIGRNEHLDLRLISSLIRHNTILQKPLIGLTRYGHLIDPDTLVADWKRAIKTSTHLVTGRYHLENRRTQPRYVPVGY